MGQYFAVAVTRTGHGWVAQELDLDGVKDLDGLAELLHDVSAEQSESRPVLLLLEEDDEYVGIARLDVDGEPRCFLSDVRQAARSELAAALAEHSVAAELPVDDHAAVEEEETGGLRSAAEATGDLDLLADLGVGGQRLAELCAKEGMLPADVITAVAETLGCLDLIEELREG